ncbi:MAG: hypothetical protein AAFY80_07015 [Pseudomonadota bacterium]
MTKVVIKPGRSPNSAVFPQIDKALPPPGGPGSVIRKRRDVARIVSEIVLETRTQRAIAKNYGCGYENLRNFRKRFITPEVRQIVLNNLSELANEARDGNRDASDIVQNTLLGAVDELHGLYRRAKDILDQHDNDDFLARLGPVVRLLEQQGKNVQRLSDAMSKEHKADAVVPLASHPQAALLLSTLREVLLRHPEAHEDFLQTMREHKLMLGE